jgi:hypothetical protein
MGFGSQQGDLPLRSVNRESYDPGPIDHDLLAFFRSISNRSGVMQTISRATVMLVTLAALAWAAVRFGPVEVVQPLTSRAIELADELLSRPGGRARSGLQPLTEPSWSQPLVLAESGAGGKTTPAMPLPRVAPLPAAPVSAVVAKLESLGAQQVAVERWGQGKLHRVSCELPLSGVSSITRHFETVAANREEAALALLSEVCGWQAQHDRLSSLP